MRQPELIVAIFSIFSPAYAAEAKASVILMDSSNSIVPLPVVEGIRGFPAEIDFSKLPDIGFPKKEIKTITVMKRSKVLYQGNTLIFEPDCWKFEGPSWQALYKDRIPYLSELGFLGAGASKTGTSVKIQYKQNNLGYFLDTGSYLPGIYQAAYGRFSNVVEKIIIISAEENSLIEAMRRKLDPSCAATDQAENLQEQEKVPDNNNNQNNFGNRHSVHEIAPPVRNENQERS